MGAVMDWPETLPVALASGYSFDDAFEVIRPADSLGFATEVRRGQINKPKAVSASLLLSFDEFAVFDWLLTRKLRNGAVWVSMPLKFDDGVRSVETRIVKASPATEGRHWKVSLTLEVMTHGNTAELA